MSEQNVQEDAPGALRALRLQSAPGEGTHVTILLPAAEGFGDVVVAAA
jgi:hypothetical protein